MEDNPQAHLWKIEREIERKLFTNKMYTYVVGPAPTSKHPWLTQLFYNSKNNRRYYDASHAVPILRNFDLFTLVMHALAYYLVEAVKYYTSVSTHLSHSTPANADFLWRNIDRVYLMSEILEIEYLMTKLLWSLWNFSRLAYKYAHKKEFLNHRS